jgi:D-alanine-D-alanine ligase
VEAVEAALLSAGLSSHRIVFTQDLGSFLGKVQELQVNAFFNLCETVEENPLLCWHPASVFELLGFPFTGSPSQALMLTADKVLTKQLLLANGIRTPGFHKYNRSNDFDYHQLSFPVIVKPQFEDASIGIDQDSVFETPNELMNAIETFHARFGTVMVEEFIEGREFNVSLMGYPDPSILPIAEIDFSAFPTELYRIVGYRAKWDQASFEYKHTPRIFSDRLSNGLSSELKSIALACFKIFRLRDYGRVDIRVDDHGQVYVLEVNANPCLSPDAGLAASCQAEGLTYARIIEVIYGYLEQRIPQNENQSP